MTWYITFDDVFFLTLAGTLIGGLAMLTNAIVKSRCQSCSICFGMMKCERNKDVDLEEIHVLEHKSEGVATHALNPGAA